jgi:C4-dicarboxylate transporter, DctQ subunit
MRFWFVTLPHWLMGALMLAGVGICASNVVGRYFFGHAIFWAEEVMVFLVIWGVFLGLIAASYERAHLSMDLFSDRLRGDARKAMRGIAALGVIVCCAFMVIQSWTVVELQYQSGIVSVAAGVPRWIPNAALLVGFAFAGIAVLVRARAVLADD